MKETIIARRYARGLVEHAVDEDALGSVRDDIEMLADLLDPDRGDVSVPEIVQFLASPTVPQASKIKMTDVLCEKLKIGKIVSDFLNILIFKNRVNLTSFIAREFSRLAAESEAIVNARVESARPLSDSQLKSLEETLREVAGGKIRMKTHTNPELLGGVQVQINDTLLDGSLSRRLEKLDIHLN